MKRFIIYILVIIFSLEIIYGSAIMRQPNIQKKLFFFTLKFAKEGNYKAQYDLANLYKYGRGVAVNLKEAFHLYHLSALKGYPPAQYQLGMAFRYGLGVKANQELARYWLRKSAKNHYTHAQRIFKTYYAKKRVIRQYRFASAIDY